MVVFITASPASSNSSSRFEIVEVLALPKWALISANRSESRAPMMLISCIAIHPFPTFSEAFKHACQAFRRDTSAMSCCVE